jgi:hypothetical protein
MPEEGATVSCSEVEMPPYSIPMKNILQTWGAQHKEASSISATQGTPCMTWQVTDMHYHFVPHAEIFPHPQKELVRQLSKLKLCMIIVILVA